MQNIGAGIYRQRQDPESGHLHYWWLLSDCDLISKQSSPQPPTEYCKVDIGKWTSEAVGLSQDLPWRTDQSDVIYLGEFHAEENPRPRQPAPISPKLEPGSSNSGTATKRRIRRGRARHLKSDRDNLHSIIAQKFPQYSNNLRSSTI